MSKKNEEELKFIPYGGAGSVTGANFMLQSSKITILVDCGYEQGTPSAEEQNRKDFAYDPAKVDVLFVTHAHADHIGRIPKLVRDGFRGKIYSTEATKEISKIMYEDALKIMSYEYNTTPLYEKKDVDMAFSLWQEVSYHQKAKISEEFSFVFKDAGHVLGSAMIELVYKESKKIVFTGDLGNTPTPLLRDTEKIVDADYLIMESVYGDRNHESKEERIEKLETILKKTIARQGTIIIPAFSLERSQVLLYEINNMVEEGRIPSVPVFLDSPLAIKLTALYKRFANKNFNDGVKEEMASGDKIFSFPKLKLTDSSRESKEIFKSDGAKIVIAGSGMSTGGRVLSHEKFFLPDSKNTLLLVGYQALGTLGRELLDGAKSVVIGEEKVPVRAEIEEIFGYSSHKDMDNLIDFVSHTKETVKQVFVAMGEPKSSLFLAQRLRDFLDVKAIYPQKDKVYTLPM